MSRRRYISTQISTDTAVNKLAQRGGDFAALLYTWMIPHAADDATLPGDPEELIFIVIPGRRDKTPDDVADALRLMVDLELIEWDGKAVRFPAPAFYKYQTYIQEGKRRGPQNADEPREPADNSANQRKTAQNASSPSPSVTPSPSPTPSVTPTATPSENGDRPKSQKPKADGYPEAFETQFWEHYPKGRGSKADAFRLWSKLSGEERAAIVAAFPAFQASRDWREGFHSAPEVWLKGRRWENPPPAPPEMVDPTEAYMRGEITSPEQLLNFRRLAS